MRRRSHGLTLVETLVVLAIAGLLMAVLLAVLLPSDDRKCRLEAERLAAFLTAASAESVMRDAPVRVVFDLDRGVAIREVAKVGADITSALWQEDEKAEIYEISAPVRFEAVDSAESPEQTSGNGYLIFRGERTEGAVVVLGLEQVFYSVLVPPNGAEIKVEKGRQGRPSGGGSPINRDLQPFADAIGGGDGIGNMPSGGLGGVSPNNLNLGGAAGAPRAGGKNNNKDLKSRDNNTEPPTVNNNNNTANNNPPAVNNSGKPALDTVPNPPIETPPEEPPANDIPEGAPSNTINQTCLNDLQCGPADGWAKCNTEIGYCEINPVGRTLRMTDLRVTKPVNPQISNIVESVMQAQIAQGRLHLLTYFDSGKVWVVQGERAGEQQTESEGLLKRFRQVNSFPSYQGADLPTEGYDCESIDLGNDKQEHRCEVAQFELASGDAQIYIQKSNDPPLNTCNYEELTLAVKVQIRATIDDDLKTTVTGAADDNQPKTFIRLSTTLSTQAARNISVQGNTLYDLLQGEIPLDGVDDEAPDPEDVADLNDDGQPDAWVFVFEGSAEAVSIAETPYENPDARPQFCL